MNVNEENYLMHYGTPRHSGRYPWGSGDNPYQRNVSFIGYVEKLRKDGLSDVEIARGMGISTGTLRARKAIAREAIRRDNVEMAKRLKEKGYSNIAIGKRMGVGESTVRNWLEPNIQDRMDTSMMVAKALKEQVDSKGAIDIGFGVGTRMGISETKLGHAVEILEAQGYKVEHVDVKQLGTSKNTHMKVITRDDVQWKDLVKDPSKVKTFDGHYEEETNKVYKTEPPRSVSSKRVAIVYDEDGGSQKDGLIELRRGVEDISLGKANYAQVRISVDGTHYLKGMAMYADDLPDGIDIRFNTNKKKGTPMMGDKDHTVLKNMKDDPDNPFGAIIRGDNDLVLAQRHYVDKNGKIQLSALNIVNEEGNWGEWSKTLASQVVSKQSPQLAKKLLGIAYNEKKDEYDEIMALTNPTIKKRLLESFADDCDSSAVHLKAAGMPRQATHVILPFPKMKENEIYAPNYQDGENVILIRYPHGGIFEIPQLRVNNKNPEAKKALKNAKDAVGINYKVAEQLSGADFDGDTVLVIPNRGGVIKTSSPLAKLKGFDPKKDYKLPEDAPRATDKIRNMEMGKVTNLVTDMTIKGANQDEIARAVRHSMVVIDSAKHGLDYKKSYEDNGIRELQKKYQAKEDGRYGGSSTLISRAKSPIYVDATKKVYEKDPVTGATIVKEVPDTYTKTKITRTGEVVSIEVARKRKTTVMAEIGDARTISSGTPMENAYADHANKLKRLGEKAREDASSTPKLEYSPSAAKTYAPEVASLKAKLNEAYKNKPLERQAQALANAAVSERKRDNPDLGGDELKKVEGQQLAIARNRIGAQRKNVIPTAKEWEAIQAGAVHDATLQSIIDNSDLDAIKKLATPRTANAIPTAVANKAKFMLEMGYTQAEVADRLNISTSAVNKLA